MEQLEEFVLEYSQSARVKCPECGDSRKKKNEKTLSITVNHDHSLYHCHHCGLSGGIKRKKFYEAYMKKEKVVNIPTDLNSNVTVIKDFFRHRGVQLDSLEGLPRMTTGTRSFRGESMPAIGFVYGAVDNPTAIKWRSIISKDFICEGAPRSFYGIEELEEDADDLIVVEGEADVISLASIGIRAVSCPNGAPVKVSQNKISPEEDGKFSFVWDERERFEGCKRVVLATDNDEPGEALAEEIARRVGRAKCWRVHFPESIKDANDAVARLGEAETKRIFSEAQPVPLSGVYAANDYMEQVKDIYANGHGRGVSTGIPAIDDLFTIAEGQLSVVTGLPSSGKSEFIDQIMVNLAQKEKWKFAVCSFENPPQLHISKLCEKITGKPFFEGMTPRMTEQEMSDAVGFINDHFVFLESKDGGLSTIDSIIDRIKQAVFRLGCRGAVIDPYNFIEHQGQEEHQSISMMLTKITSFCKAAGIHIWFVAHPAKMYPREDGTYAVPKGMSISGSAAWFAKADLGITVHRGDNDVEVHCWKSRFKWVGQQGVAKLKYDVVNGTYSGESASQNILADLPSSDVSKLRGVDWYDVD